VSTALDTRSEKEIQSDIRRLLELHGYQVDDMSQPRRSMMPVGLPDLRARHVKREERFWVEVKRPGNAPTSAQREWHEAEREAGGEVYVVTSAAQMHEILLDRRTAA